MSKSFDVIFIMLFFAFSELSFSGNFLALNNFLWSTSIFNDNLFGINGLTLDFNAIGGRR